MFNRCLRVEQLSREQQMQIFPINPPSRQPRVEGETVSPMEISRSANSFYVLQQHLDDTPSKREPEGDLCTDGDLVLVLVAVQVGNDL